MGWVELLNLMSKMSLGLFFILDHIAWLTQVKIGFKGDTKAAIRRGIKFSCLSNFFQMLYQLCLCRRQQLSAGPSVQAFRSLLMALQGLHNSQLKVLHDTPVGAFGICTSLLDCHKIWAESVPKKK